MSRSLKNPYSFHRLPLRNKVQLPITDITLQIHLHNNGLKQAVYSRLLVTNIQPSSKAFCHICKIKTKLLCIITFLQNHTFFDFVKSIITALYTLSLQNPPWYWMTDFSACIRYSWGIILAPAWNYLWSYIIISNDLKTECQNSFWRFH